MHSLSRLLPLASKHFYDFKNYYLTLANAPGDQGSFPGRVIPKTRKLVLDISRLNTLHFKVRIKGKVEQSKERRSSVLNLLKMKLSGRP